MYMTTVIITNEYRDQIGKRLTNRIGDAVENGELIVDDVPDCCDAILAVIDTISSYDQMIAFLKKLSTHWPFFGTILETEEHHTVTVETIQKTFQSRSQSQNK